MKLKPIYNMKTLKRSINDRHSRRGRNQGKPSKMKVHSKRRGAKHLADNEGFKLKGNNGSVLLQTHREQLFKKGSSYQKHLTNFPFSGALKGAAEKGQMQSLGKLQALTHVLSFIPILFLSIINLSSSFLCKNIITLKIISNLLPSSSSFNFTLTFLPNAINFTIPFCHILELG